MASFPTSVKVFTAKVPGGVIQSATDNDEQDEINAIESGYLSGTARLNSSNSTLANLSVTGGSTLATLDVAGQANLGSLSISAMGPYVQAHNSTNIQVANNAMTLLTFNNEDVASTSGLHSTAGSSNHVFIATSSGVWQVSASIRWRTASTGLYLLRVRYNDVQCIAEHSLTTDTAFALTQSVTTMWRMQIGDFFDLWAYQLTGTTNSLFASDSSNSTEINGCRASFAKIR